MSLAKQVDDMTANEYENPIKCSVCGEEFTSDKGLNLHFTRQHE